MIRFLSFLCLSSILFSCGYSNEQTKEFDTQIKQYIAQKHLDLKPTGSGLYLKIDSLGTGKKIQIQDSIWVTYQLFLLTGERIEKQDQPIVMGGVILVSAVFILVNVLVEWVYGILDPRIRTSSN